MDHFVDKARRHSKRNEYQEAIKCYDKAIARTPSAQLLDERSGCYVRTNDLPAALKDAKAAVQLASADPTGYLRAGMVLLRMKEKNAALEVTRYGLKRVKHVGKTYEELRNAHEQLLLEMSPTKSIDPLTVLPRELALMVLDYLSFRQRMAIMRVSKAWSKYIRSCPDLWRHLDLSAGRQKIRTLSVKAYVAAARMSITEVSLNNMFDFDLCLSLILRQCPITHLRLGPSIPRLGLSLITAIANKRSLKAVEFPEDQEIDTPIIRTFAQTKASFLEELDVSPRNAAAPLFYEMTLPKMRQLSLRYNHLDARLLLPYANLPAMPHLQCLKLVCRAHAVVDEALSSALMQLRDLQDLDLQLTDVKLDALVLPPSITRLRLGYRLDNSGGLKRPGASRLHLPNLEALCIATPCEVNAKALAEAFLGVNTEQSEPGLGRLLHILSLAACRMIGTTQAEDGMNHLLSHPRLKHLKVLEIQEASPWDDEDMQSVAKHLTTLQHLHISCAPTMTGVGVKTVLSSVKLNCLEMCACDGVSPDAIAWARTQPAKVLFTRSLASRSTTCADGWRLKK